MAKKILEKPLNIIPGVGYGRASTLGQVNDDKGFRRDDSTTEMQKTRCGSFIDFLKHKSGINYKIIKHISDEGFSGKNTNRPGFRELWNLIATRQIKFVVGVELSRFARNVAEFLSLVNHAEKNDVKIFIIGIDLDTSTPIGRVVVTILCALAQFEREITAERTRENAMARLLRDGKINGSAEILGLARDPNRKGHFLVDPDGLRTAESIMKMFLKFSSKKKVLQFAKEAGLTGKSGKELTIRQIEYVLKNAETRYRGIWHANHQNRDKDQNQLPSSHKYQEVILPHGPLIDVKILDEVSEKIKDTHEKKKRSGAEDYTYLLSHILVHEGGSRFQGQCAKDRQYRYYHNREKNIRLRCEETDQIIIKRLKSYLRDDHQFGALVENALRQRDTAIGEIEREIKLKQREVASIDSEDSLLTSELIGHLRSGGATANWLDEKVTTLRNKKEQWDSQLQLLESQRQNLLNQGGLLDLKKSINEFIEGFDKLTGTQKRNLIEKIVKKVVIKPNNKMELVLYQIPGKTRQSPLREKPIAKKGKKNPVPFSSATDVVAQEKSTGEEINGVRRPATTSKLLPHCLLHVAILPKREKLKKTRELFALGHSYQEIAKQLGQSRELVRRQLEKLGLLQPVSTNSMNSGPKVLWGRVRWNSPYGFKYERGKAIPHIQEYETLRVIMQLHKSGKNAREIADHLNEQKLRPRIAKKWDRCTVHRILEWHESNPQLLQEVSWVSKN